jgi:beta-glucanase (GH16 family)
MTDFRTLGARMALLVPALAFVQGACSASSEDPGPPHSTVTVGSAACPLVWSDEFDGPAGSQPDPAKWNLIETCRPPNGELECYTSRPENVSLDGQGHLLLTARRETYQDRNFTSGRIESKGKFEHAYGRWEARVKFPVDLGLWPAFWLLGNDIDTRSWPRCGETDIAENRGSQPTILYMTMHGPNHSGINRLGTGFDLGTNLGLDFHTAAIEWEPNVVRFYLDDVLRETVTSEDSGTADWVWNHPFFAIFNVAVGGGFPGPVDPSTLFPTSMVVDYLRVCDFASP